MKPKTHKKLFYEILTYFLPVYIIPLILVLYLLFEQTRTAIEADAIHLLKSISSKHTLFIENYLLEQQAVLHSLTKTPVIQEAFVVWPIPKSTETQTTLPVTNEPHQLEAYLQNVADKNRYEDIFLITMDGWMIFSVKHNASVGTNLKTGPLKDSQLANAFIRSTTLLESEISAFEFNKETKSSSGYIAAPVFQKGRFLGVVALQINIKKLNSVINNYKGLKNTGESVVAQKQGNKAVFTAPTRFDSNATFKRFVSLESPSPIPIQEAVNQATGSGLRTDYRGEKVLAVWKYLPSIRWGLVVKMDQSEAYAPITKIKNLAIILGSTSLLMVFAAVLAISRKVTTPIAELTEKTQKIAQGDWSQTISTTEQNEIALLANSFNLMTNQLTENYTQLSKVNQQLTQRNSEFLKINEELGKAHIELNKKNILLTDKLRELKQSNEDLENFALIASHDLNEPIRKIISFSKLIQDGVGELPPRERRYLEIVISGGKRMQKLIDEILSYSRLTKIQVPFEDIDLNLVLREIEETLSESIMESKASIEYENLPAVKGNHTQLVQLFQNLISNSIQYRQGNIPLIVQITSNRIDNQTLNVIYQDNGLGFPQKLSDQIFQPFKRYHTTVPGTGMGLSICKKIAVYHGGDITVDSVPNEGSTFTITFTRLPNPEYSQQHT